MSNFVRRALGGLCSGMCVGLAPAACADDAETILLHHVTRPPYEQRIDGEVRGLVADPVAAAFRKAGIAFKWAETPVARQFYIVKQNQGLDCLAGRFKNAERESWANFSRPVYRDLPQGLLVRADHARMKSYASMAAALKDESNRILVKLAYSYGPVIDGWLKQRVRPTVVTADESPEMLRRLHKGQADAWVIAEEEAVGLLRSTEVPAEDFEFLRFRDSPPGELRYVMCSKRVPASIVEKLDAAIAFNPR